MKTLVQFIISVIYICCFVNVNSQNDYKLEDKTTKIFSLDDYHAFKRADSLYIQADTLPYSYRADASEKAILQYFKSSRLLEKDEVWKELLKLEPYRKDPRMVTKINNIADQLKATITFSNTFYLNRISGPEAKKFSALYKTVDFETFINEGRILLLRDPLNSDIRNNVALALMHANKDLCACVELETIRRLDSLHIPALINLTVVYERLGRREDAQKLANQLLKIQEQYNLKNPKLNYNAAWLMYIDGKNAQADSLLSRIRAKDITGNENIKSLKKLNKKGIEKYMKQLPIFEFGIMGKLGYEVKNDFFSWYFIIASIIFLVALIIFMIVRMNRQNSNLFLLLLFCCFILALVYIIAWGLPTAETWYYFVIYSLLPFILLIVLSILFAMFSS
jgi:tetratricopeptide (TPR) repeat protein